MSNCWSMSRYTIPVMVVSVKKKGPCTVSLMRAQNTFTFGLSRTCSRETRGFSLLQILQWRQRCYVACGKTLITGGTSAALPMEVISNHNYPRYNSVWFAKLWHFEILHMSSEYIYILLQKCKVLFETLCIMSLLFIVFTVVPYTLPNMFWILIVYFISPVWNIMPKIR
jgi:hypothetical protein